MKMKILLSHDLKFYFKKIEKEELSKIKVEEQK